MRHTTGTLGIGVQSVKYQTGETQSRQRNNILDGYLCPLLTGKSRFANQDGQSYKCDKCGKTYLASDIGKCLKVTISQDGKSVEVAIFNKTAEKATKIKS